MRRWSGRGRALLRIADSRGRSTSLGVPAPLVNLKSAIRNGQSRRQARVCRYSINSVRTPPHDFGVEEGDAPAFVQAGARDVVEQLDSGGAALLQRGVDVLDLVGDVVHTRTALGERFRDRAIRTERGRRLRSGCRPRRAGAHGCRAPADSCGARRSSRARRDRSASIRVQVGQLALRGGAAAGRARRAGRSWVAPFMTSWREVFSISKIHSAAASTTTHSPGVIPNSDSANASTASRVGSTQSVISSPTPSK